MRNINPYLSKKDRIILYVLGLFVSVFCVMTNFRFISLLNNWESVDTSPFRKGTPYLFNLFNFDPIIYYGSGGSSLIHPFFRIIAFPIQWFAALGPENLLLLFLQSLIIGATASLIYLYCRTIELPIIDSLLISLIFSTSTYSLVTSFTPDSYVYAQLILVASVVYFQYSSVRTQSKNTLGLTILAVLNFGITITNAIPYAISTFISESGKPLKQWAISLLKIALFSFLIIVLLIGIDILFFPGTSWIFTWQGTLQNGGYKYVSNFSFEQHMPALYSLFLSPFVFPYLEVLQPETLRAVVTHVTHPFDTWIIASVLLFLVISMLGLLLNLKEKSVWILIVFIGFSIWLHLFKGFGLSVFKYDMFLYAGHYIFAIILGAAWLLKKTIPIPFLHTILRLTLLIILLVQVTHNLQMNDELINSVSVYF